MENIDIIRKLETADDAPSDPYALFGEWFQEATISEPSDPNAMCLATVNVDGTPNARMVLMKGYDDGGFVFYTNRESQKGQELAQNQHVALCFHWKTLTRQIRVLGTVQEVSSAEADAYYETRSRGSRIGAWASQQSRPLLSRSALADRVKELDAKFGDTDTIPRPPHWTGFRVTPTAIEFWHDGAYRLHTRILYKLNDGVWQRVMLNP